MLKRLAVLVAVLAVSATGWAEPTYLAVNVSQTVQSVSLPRSTQEVTIVSDGASTCYYRLFTDADTAGNATTSSAPIKLNEVHKYKLNQGSGAEGYVGTTRASYYKSISAICATGLTAAWRVYTK